jgi:hypothetical protein
MYPLGCRWVDVQRPAFSRRNVSTTRHVLLALHVVACCVSLSVVGVVHRYFPHMPWFGWEQAPGALAATGAFSVVSFLLFRHAAFSFGYFIGFYFFTIILGYLWLGRFSQFDYAYESAAASAFAAGIAFLVPALLLKVPLRRGAVLSPVAFNAMLMGIPVAAVAVVAVGSFYHFRLIEVGAIYQFRDAIQFPLWLSYALGIMSTSVIPFAFACFVERRQYWRAGTCLVLLLALYPVTLSKVVLFAPLWLMFLLVLSSRFEARAAVIVSLLLPIGAGLLSSLATNAVFNVVNFRMIAIPSMSLDIYNSFFSHHPLTHFCQVSMLKPLMDCPYSESLGAVMQQTYHSGSWNAFLFATEGVASVGLLLAPLVALVAGLLVALANTASASLPSRFIILSSGILVHTLINVPFTTAMLTHGAGLLVLLWYVTPKEMLQPAGKARDFENRDAFRMPLAIQTRMILASPFYLLAICLHLLCGLTTWIAEKIAGETLDDLSK